MVLSERMQLAVFRNCDTARGRCRTIERVITLGAFAQAQRHAQISDNPGHVRRVQIQAEVA